MTAMAIDEAIEHPPLNNDSTKKHGSMVMRKYSYRGSGVFYRVRIPLEEDNAISNCLQN
jgi:hypothetical protein